MKKLYAVLLFTFTSSFFTSFCEAQFNVYHPFPDSNAWWSESYFTYGLRGDYLYGFDYYTDGDTIVAGKNYIKVHYSEGSEDDFSINHTFWYSDDYLFCLIREDTVARKVYASFYPNLGSDTLLYDFSLHVGDTLQASYLNSDTNKNYVKAIDSVFIGSQYRKQIIITNVKDSNYWKDYIIEGMGSVQGLFTQFVYQPEGSYHSLNCYSVNDTTLYPSLGGSCQKYIVSVPNIVKLENSISVYPNPSSGNYKFQITNYAMQKVNIEVFNVLGEKVYSQFTTQSSPLTIDLSSNPNGIYLYRITDANSNLIGTGKLMIQK